MVICASEKGEFLRGGAAGRWNWASEILIGGNISFQAGFYRPVWPHFVTYWTCLKSQVGHCCSVKNEFMKNPIRVAVTGAAGNIGYAILFRIASGEIFGADQPVILHLVDIEPALPALQGVVMELND